MVSKSKWKGCSVNAGIPYWPSRAPLTIPIILYKFTPAESTYPSAETYTSGYLVLLIILKKDTL